MASAVIMSRVLNLMSKFLRERPAAMVFTVALSVRVALALIVYFAQAGVLFRDDAVYLRLAAAAVSGASADWSVYYRHLYWSTGGLTFPLTAFTRLGLPMPLAGQLFVAVCGALAAGLLTHLCYKVVSSKLAVIGGLLIALLPSQVLFSAVTLKDAEIWATLLILAVALKGLARVPTPAAVLSMLAAWIVLALLREHTLIIASWALACTVWVSAKRYRLWSGVAVTLLAVVIPLAVGLGPAGLDLVLQQRSFDQRRAANAEGAGTAVVAGRDGLIPQVAVEQQGIESAGEEVAEGASDARPEDEVGSAEDRRTRGSLAYLPRGLSVILLEPVPWRRGDLPTRLAQAETLVWYPLLVLALIGAPRLLRVRAVGVFALLVAGGLILVYALTEGNYGTAYRHRGEFAWVVVLAAMCGLATLQDLRQRMRLRGATRQIDNPPIRGGSDESR